MSEKPPNDLNPGKSFGRKAISGCKCLCLVFTGVVVAGIGLMVAVLLAGTAKGVLAPHAAAFHDKALSAVADRATVVQPLIGRSDKFDMLVTVWLRNEDSPRHDSPKRLKKIRPVQVPGQPQDQPAEEIVDELLPVEEDSTVTETPLYSEIVFRGMTLKDKNVYRDINLAIPTTPFRGTNLTNYDLRASVVLIPHSPSLLDQTTNYSTWIPDSLKLLPVRPHTTEHDLTLADRVIDTFSDSFPLLEFHGIPSQCPKVEKTRETTNPFLDDGEPDEQHPTESDLGPNKRAGSTLQTTDGRNPLYSHPYIVTRTQIRVVDETGIFNRKAYIKEHKQLKENSCGQRNYIYPGRYFCQKNWPNSGHWETQLQLSVVNETTKEPQTEWAYGPYVYATRHWFGQHDLLPIPVNRETCMGEGQLENPEVPETFNVTWHISYSGRTAAKMALGDIAQTTKYFNFNETDLEKYKAHEAASKAHGMWGNPFSEKDYSRTRMGIHFYALIGGFVETLLGMRYWYTRKSIEGISTWGTKLIAASDIIPDIHDFYTANRNKGRTIPEWVLFFLVMVITNMPVAILMLKAVYKVYFHWWTETSWFPAAGVAEPSKNEKASERIDGELSWTFRGGLLLTLFALNWYFDLPNYVLVKASFPLPEKEEKGSNFMPALFFTIKLVGRIQQLILNARMRKYAGAYAITTYLKFSITLFTIVEDFSGILGRTGYTDNMRVLSLITLVVWGVAAFQAWMFPPVSQEEDGLHEE